MATEAKRCEDRPVIAFRSHGLFQARDDIITSKLVKKRLEAVKEHVKEEKKEFEGYSGGKKLIN